jgi:hypothetical protein
MLEIARCPAQNLREAPIRCVLRARPPGKIYFGQAGDPTFNVDGRALHAFYRNMQYDEEVPFAKLRQEIRLALNGGAVPRKAYHFDESFTER